MLDEFYLPTPRQFCKRANTRGRRHCTGAWMELNGIQLTVRNKELWHQAADKAGISKLEWRNVICVRNDLPETTLEQLADAFERFVVKLGYEVMEV